MSAAAAGGGRVSAAAGVVGAASRRGEEPYPDRGEIGGVVAAVDGTASRRRLNPDRGGTGGVVGTASRRRLKYLASINDDVLGEDTDPDFEMEYIDIGNVDSSGRVSELASYRFEDAPSRARRRVRDGDVIISTVRTYLQAITQIREPSDNLVVSTGFAVVRPRPDRFDARYCRFALREPAFLAEVERCSVGVSYPAINATDLADIPISIHPLQTQRAIADHLDRETTRLDALVAAKQRLLALLAEKHRAVITRAVTCGLDPRVPLRDSGVPWLGQIPAHWRLTRLKFVVDVRGGLALGKDYGFSDLEEYSYIRVANVQDGYLNLDEVKTVQIPKREAENYLLQTGDVLMNEGGDDDKLGRGCIWNGEVTPCLHQNHVFAVRPRLVEPEWIDTWASSDAARFHFELHAKRTTNLASISAANLKELPLLVPPAEERREILCRCAGSVKQFLTAQSKIVSTAALLNERRAALIAAAVTGKLDVGSAS